MRFHAILVVRDEGDIIGQWLDHTLRWADSLHVLDTGSTDGTWEIITDRARDDRRIRPIEYRPCMFHNGLRAEVFDRARHAFRPGDWITRFDADEFPHVDPPEFVRTRLGTFESRVAAQHYDFVLTRSEAFAWEAGLETPADRARPIETRRRYYLVNDHAELRMFRYRRSMRWEPWVYSPRHAGFPARVRIPVRHYRCRDPDQMRRRCAIRAEAFCRQVSCIGPVARSGRHWIEPPEHLIVDDARPDLRHWEPGTDLPAIDRPIAHPLWRRRRRDLALYATGLIRLRDARPRREPARMGVAPETVQA